MIIEAIVRRLPERFTPEASLRSLFAVTSLSLGALTGFLIAYCHQRHAEIQASIDQRRALIAQTTDCKHKPLILKSKLRRLEPPANSWSRNFLFIPRNRSFDNALRQCSTV